MNTRKISFIEEDENQLEVELRVAQDKTIGENLIDYCNHIAANFLMAGIDIYNYPVKKNIYFIEDED